ncbi:MAG: helix-turn-helix domain-containing protein [Myxococcota bacterium]|nr:helix-turn-helix domain-containing protein [Myxococcota bacterium]
MRGSDRVESQAIGSYLRWQRELREISVEELADLTRVPVRSIERLEAGAFDDQVDGFVKGFVRTVAESLGLDAEDTLSRMLSEPEPEDRRLINLKRRTLRALVGLAAVSLVGILIFVIQELSTREARTSAEAREQIIFRRDPVRALAASRSPSVALPGELEGLPEAAADPND